MATRAKEEIELQGGAKALAQMPVCYCYANANNAAAMENWRRHCQHPSEAMILDDGRETRDVRRVFCLMSHVTRHRPFSPSINKSLARVERSFGII